MARGILIVDHGSRLAEANALLERLAARVRERLPDRLVAIAHLELAPPSLDDALVGLIEQGATDIVVHPYFLAPGRHSTHDIPERVAALARCHPGVVVRLAEPLGLHPGLVEAVVERLRQAES